MRVVEHPGHGGPREDRRSACPSTRSRTVPLMPDCFTSGNLEGVSTLDELRTFVHETLCAKEGLLPDQFPLSEMLLAKRARFCGLQFSLQGPRDVRLGAIWASDHNVLYLYDARGERYLKLKLTRRVVMTPSETLRDAA